MNMIICETPPDPALNSKENDFRYSEFPAVSKTGSAPLKVPYCYYPKNFQGYSVLNQTGTDKGLTAYLKRGKASQVDKDIDLLRIEVINQSEDIVRIRIVDPTTQRWEPPLPAIPVPSVEPKTKYIVEVTSESRLKVSRFEDSVTGTTL